MLDYVDIVYQECPPAIYQDIVRVEERKQPTEEMVFFSPITSILLTDSCAYGVVGYLSTKMSTERTDIFKANYLSLVGKYEHVLKNYGTVIMQKQIKDEIALSLHVIIDDITKSHLRGNMLTVLRIFKINMLDEIDKRIDYKSLTFKGYMGDWQFNEYAASMGDAKAHERLALVFAKSSAQDLRLIFAEIRGKHKRAGYSLPPELIKELVQPHLLDHRRTQDVTGDGPAVAHYARELLDSLE